MLVTSIFSFPPPPPPILFFRAFVMVITPLPHDAATVENIVRKGETACNKQFLLFLQCFLPYMALIFHFEYTLKCCLQFVSI